MLDWAADVVNLIITGNLIPRGDRVQISLLQRIKTTQFIKNPCYFHMFGSECYARKVRILELKSWQLQVLMGARQVSPFLTGTRPFRVKSVHPNQSTQRGLTCPLLSHPREVCPSCCCPQLTDLSRQECYAGNADLCTVKSTSFFVDAVAESCRLILSIPYFEPLFGDFLRPYIHETTQFIKPQYKMVCPEWHCLLPRTKITIP